MTAQDPAAIRIDTSRPHTARVYDWLLGGKDNYPVDEEMGKQLLAMVDPHAKEFAWINRGFMHRATRYAAEELGIRQFLDIGTGIPTEPNLHQIAQGVAPEARVVYCDNDPIVLAHAAALLRSTPEGVTEYVQADARETETILEKAGKVLDFTGPVAVSLCALLHFIGDEDAYPLVSRLMEPLAPGSCLIISHGTGDFSPEGAEKGKELYRKGGHTLRTRSRAEIARFFEGMEMVEPGISIPTDWRPELGEVHPMPDGPVPGYVAMARKV
ncbi:SAM-dependent methyltransferase [Streptomyces sp. GC420]|uniref:SAM-dependent methyltransferase n=1 Tax=Streptomyces sp. GC420 TaxID=2697568 RepID=UPI0014152A5F|nr:SAM-dependent methyltransferase [Streptomyces sp. GC420]NBM16943.1 SAM-dependent methyltransferase [Streptomyces sp. GC420]